MLIISRDGESGLWLVEGWIPLVLKLHSFDKGFALESLFLSDLSLDLGGELLVEQVVLGILHESSTVLFGVLHIYY